MISGLLMPAIASADVNNFVITDFSADETLSRNDPQGELRIKEDIKVNFSDNNHGLLRAIPLTYKRHSLQMTINSITSPSNASVSYTSYITNNNKVLKIGDLSQTVTGPQEYVIDYTLRNVVTIYNDHDELYWDVNGDQWPETFYSVLLVLHLPSDLKLSRQPVCYAGAYNSNAQNCTIKNVGSDIIALTTTSLGPNQTLTYVAGFQKGYFQPSKWYETLGEYAKSALQVLIPFVLISTASIAWWFKKGRDPKGTGIIIPEYGPPDNLKPLEVGFIYDLKLKNQSITATIIDLAIKGYIKIIETKSGFMGIDKSNYSLQLLKEDFGELDANEKNILNSIFEDVDVKSANISFSLSSIKQAFKSPIDVSTNQQKIGQTVSLDSLKSTLSGTTTLIGTSIGTVLKAQGYISASPLDNKGKLISQLVSLGAALYLIHAIHLTFAFIGVALGTIVYMICLKFMGVRTVRGVATNEKIKGLKLYLEVAEKDRINKLQSPNAAYSEKSNEPFQTVDLFEKLLPYAMVLGIEKEWGKQFENIYLQPPTWYSGNWSTFNSVYLVSSLNSGFGKSIATAFASPSSSGGTGFSGGFSGGGGGGGGGGGF